MADPLPPLPFPSHHNWSALTALQLIASERVTRFTGVPTMSLELLNHPDYDRYDTSSLQSLGGGGAARQYHVPRSGFMTDKSAEDFWLETAFSWFNLLEKLAGFRSDLRGRLDLWKTGVGAGGTYMDSARATRINKYFG